MHSKRDAYRSRTGRKTAELMAKPVMNSSGSPLPCLLTDIGARRVLKRLVPTSTQRLGRVALAARALIEPARPVAPPRAGRLRRGRQPRFGVVGELIVDPVGRLRVAGRVHERGDMAAG